MKTKKLVSWLFGAALILLSASSSFAREGGSVGNGGDVTEIEFRMLGDVILQFLETATGVKSFPEVSPREFRVALQAVKIVSTANYLNGSNAYERTATNFPDENIILVNRENWRKGSKEAKLAIVFHEYLGIIGLERGGYQISSRLQRHLDQLSIPACEIEKTCVRRISPCFISGVDFVEPFKACDKCKENYSRLDIRTMINVTLVEKKVCYTSSGALFRIGAEALFNEWGPLKSFDLPGINIFSEISSEKLSSMKNSVLGQCELVKEGLGSAYESCSEN